MKTIGVVLVILGAIALAYGVFDYNGDRTILKVGSAEVSAGDGRNLPVPAIIGAVVLLGGFALVMAGNRSMRT